MGVPRMADTILIVDDEKEIADLIALYLTGEGFAVNKFYDSTEALASIEREPYSLAILDVMMPELDGFSLCQRIRESHTFPIILLTAKDDEIDKITGLTLGADDYVTKPFKPLELVARVKAQLRRSQRYNDAPDKESGELLAVGGLAINPGTHKCTLDGRELTLTPTEFSILQALAEKCGRVISAEDLFHAVWGDEYYDKNNNTVTVHIRHLREKMGESIDRPGYIKTVWGVGYKIEAK